MQSNSVSPLPIFDTEEEDSDDWLTIDAEGFETMLENTLGGSTNIHKVPSDAMEIEPSVQEIEEDRIAKEQASKLQDLAKKVEDFVEGEGNIEGAQFEEFVVILTCTYLFVDMLYSANIRPMKSLATMTR